MGDDSSLNAAFRQVEDWLRSLGLICYAQSFYDNGYENLAICSQITEQDLGVIGITNVKDKNDILAGVCRLKQKTVYFELEPEEEQSQEVVLRKYDPFLLITRVKAELEKDNVQLTEPPYFYPDGSLGTLDSLAENISFKLETFSDDVRNALDQLRRRQLPASVYNDVNELMDMQRQQELKKSVSGKKIGPPKPKRERDQPKEYLNVETPSFRRTTSLSKHDKRITKSTTNLADAEFDIKPLVLDGRKGKKSKQLAKSFSTREKGKNFLGISVRKRSTTGENKTQKGRDSFVAKDLTMDQKELIDLMTKVKHGELSQDSVVAQATLNYRQSVIGDLPALKGLDRHQLTKKEKKKLEKEEKKRRKTERGKSSAHSTFYTSELADPNGNHSMTSPIIDHDEFQGEDIISLGHSSGSDISRESPDFRSFGEKRTQKIDNGHAGFVNEESPNTSSGSLNLDQQTSDVRRTGSKARSNSVKSLTKPNKVPPPIPIRRDQASSDTNLDSQPAVDNHPAANLLSTFGNKRSLKSTLSAPLSSIPPEGAPTIPVEQQKYNSDKGVEISKEEENSIDPNVFQVKSFPFALKDLQEIKSKSDEIKRRSLIPNFEKTSPIFEGTDDHPLKPTPKAPVRSDTTTGQTQVTAITMQETGKTDHKDSNENAITKEEPKKKVPVPPPRRTTPSNSTDEEPKDTGTKPVEARPVIPPRKRRSASYEPGSNETAENESPILSRPNDPNTIPGARKPVTKPKPALPPRQLAGISSAHETEEKPLSMKNASHIKETESKARQQVENAKERPDVVTKQRPFRLRSLEELIRLKLRKEEIVISEHPYTNQDGGWSVPFPLVARYSSELEKPLEPVIKSLDSVRCDQLETNGRSAKHAILKEVLQSSDLDPITTSLEGWLISVGLPMFISDFKECGLQSFELLHDVTREEVLAMGVFEGRHVDKLIELLKNGK